MPWLPLVLVVALVGFGGGIAGFFVADQWMSDDTDAPASVSTRDMLQPSNTAAPRDGSGTSRAVADEDALTPGDIYRAVSPAVVHIEAKRTSVANDGFFGTPQEQESTGTGSGFVIDDKGHIVTNAHVVQGASELSVGLGEDVVVPAKLIGQDTSTDIAVIKIDPKAEELTIPLSIVPFGDSTKLAVGDPVVAIGNPFSLDRTLTTGVVSALQRRIPALNEGFEISDVIQTDAAVNPGNSGGPLLNMRGEVVGVNSQIETRSGGFDGIAFAVPSSTTRSVAEQLIKSGKVAHAWLGLAGGELTESVAEALDLPVKEGVLIGSVTPGSPAADAGIQGGSPDLVLQGTDINPGGDIILEVDGEKVTTMRELAAKVDAKEPGDELELKLLQDRRAKTVTVELGTRPENGSSDG